MVKKVGNIKGFVIGTNGGFAVFPDYETGLKAMKKLALVTYGTYTIKKANYQ